MGWDIALKTSAIRGPSAKWRDSAAASIWSRVAGTGLPLAMNLQMRQHNEAAQHPWYVWRNTVGMCSSWRQCWRPAEATEGATCRGLDAGFDRRDRQGR